MVGKFGNLWNKYHTPPAAQACREARIEVMKRYSLIRSDVFMITRESCVWIDPEVDTILLWSYVWRQPQSIRLVSDQIRCIDFCKETEMQIRRTSSSALGTTSMRDDLDGEWHVAIPIIYLKALSGHGYQGTDRYDFIDFVQDRNFASLTFVWNITDDTDFGLNGAELVEEEDGNGWCKNLIQASKERVDKDIVNVMNFATKGTPVPVFKVARVQECSP
jgi:hypothetical protein